MNSQNGKPRELRVLFITRSLSDGGAAVAINRYLNALTSAQNLKISIFTGIGNLEYLRKFIYYIYKLINILLTGHNLFGVTVSLNLFSTLPRRITTSSYDIVHLNWVALDYLTISKINSIKKKTIWTIHDEQIIDGVLHFPRQCEFLWSDFLRRRFHSNLKKLVNEKNIIFAFPSLSLKSKFNKKFPSAKTVHIPNPVPLKEYSIESSQERFLTKSIAVGGFSIFNDPRKGLDLLTAAIPKIEVLSQFKINVFGEKAPNNKALKSLTIHGLLSSDQVQNLISEVRFVVVPSRDENFPSIILEAMALGVPVIGTRVGGIPEMIDDGVNGFLCDPTEQDLTNCLQKALELSKEEYLKMSKSAHDFVSKEYSFDAIMQKYLDVYTQ